MTNLFHRKYTSTFFFSDDKSATVQSLCTRTYYRNKRTTRGKRLHAFGGLGLKGSCAASNDVSPKRCLPARAPPRATPGTPHDRHWHLTGVLKNPATATGRGALLGTREQVKTGVYDTFVFHGPDESGLLSAAVRVLLLLRPRPARAEGVPRRTVALRPAIVWAHRCSARARRAAPRRVLHAERDAAPPRIRVTGRDRRDE